MGEDLASIAAAVNEKEALAETNAAQAGFTAAQATMNHKRELSNKAHKAAALRKKKEIQEKLMRKKASQEKTDKLADEAVQKNNDRLRALPQVTRSLYGKVRDATTGKSIGGASVRSSCLFLSRNSTSIESNGEDTGKFSLSNGISGPTGRQCKISVAKKGYVTTTFPVTVSKVATDSMYREAMLLPEISDEKRFRFVVQYGASVPNLDAHIMVPMPSEQYVDVGESALLPGYEKIKFSGKGNSKDLPYATLDHAAEQFGPETVSVHNVNDGEYHFLVSNAATDFTASQEFHESGARAFLYQGNKLMSTTAINSATGDPSSVWSVYSLSCVKGVCSLQMSNQFVTLKETE